MRPLTPRHLTLKSFCLLLVAITTKGDPLPFVKTQISDVAASSGLRGEVEPSAAGPIDLEDIELPEPPKLTKSRLAQSFELTQRPIEFLLQSRNDFGEVFRTNTVLPGPGRVVISHPDHARSLFTAQPEVAHSLASEGGPMRPTVSPNSILTANEIQHIRQRRILLPCFRGQVLTQCNELIDAIIQRKIDSWPVGRPFALAPHMGEIIFEVIMARLLGIEGKPKRGTPDYSLRMALKLWVSASAQPLFQMSELLLMGWGRNRPLRADGSGGRRRWQMKGVTLTRAALGLFDLPLKAVIKHRRQAPNLEERYDALSRLLQAQAEQEKPMSDEELCDELLPLMLAGVQTTTNSIAWIWERMLRNPLAYDALRDIVRSQCDSTKHVEAMIAEGMRLRPVVPAVNRRVDVPWQFGANAVRAGTPVAISILLLHHREDLYPEPLSFRPERWLDSDPTAYGWIPFGVGSRRCLGAPLTMVEQRTVVGAIARRLDLEVEDQAPERAVLRNETMIPARGTRVVIRSRLGSDGTNR